VAQLHMPILSTIEKAAQDGLREAARATRNRSPPRTPTDTGDSDKSGFTAIDDLTSQVGFRSLVSMLNHENMDWQHPNGGQSKFLEAAADQTDVEAIMAERVRRVTGG
jgi:hypothetical protein